MKTNTKNSLLLAAMFGTLLPMPLLAQTAAEREARKEAKEDAKDAKDAKKNAKEVRKDAKDVQKEARKDVRDARVDARQRAYPLPARPAPAVAPARMQRPGVTPAQRADRQQARAARLSAQQQRQLITQQRARVSQYRQYVAEQRARSRTIAAQLQAQKRMQQYQYINDYNQRLAAQQQRYSTMSFNYDSDPYFYSAPIYRYQRDGQYYTVNQSGANLLRDAVNEGYSEGYRAGRADRMDNWRPDYQASYAYQDASYGYSGYYMDRNDYSYYFRQGFRKGYDDGYYSRSQYGSYSNGRYSVLSTLLGTILNLQTY